MEDIAIQTVMELAGHTVHIVQLAVMPGQPHRI